MIRTFRKFFELAGKHKKTYYISIVFSFFHSIFEALKIAAIAVVLKALIEDSVTGQTALLSLGIMLVGIIGSIFTKNKSSMDLCIAGSTMSADQRMEIGDRLKYMPMGYFNANKLGHIASITTNTCETLQEIASRVTHMYLQSVITTIVITVALFFFDVRIGLIAVCGIALFFLINYFLQRASKKVSPRKLASESRIVDAVIEYVQGIGIVKSFNLSKQANSKINRDIEDANNVMYDIEKMVVPYAALQSLVLKLFGIGVIFASIVFYLNGTMDLLHCLLMIIASFMVYSQLESAGLFSALLRIIDLSVDKVNEVFKAPVMDEKGTVVKTSHYDITAKNVSFSYDRKKIIDNASFIIPENTTTAIIGPSGSGKTTLCHLIARFWDVDEGSISIDKKDVRDYKLDSLLANISMVFQNVYLFNDTIANNIKFGKQDASLEEIKEAARKACCHDFIMQLPEGYDTVIGEGGATISGGEKQRISIARAIIKNAPVIILDEATANVDPENEKQLQSAIEELTRHKTIIMIAHRLKTIRNADQILVLDNGKIVQSGTHASLMEQGGIYADFVAMREKSIGWKLGVA